MSVAVSPLTPAQADNVGIMNDVFAEDTRQVIRSTPYDASAPQPGFFDAVGAALWRENTLASAWHYITDGANRSLEDVQSFNPYQQLKASYDADTLDRLKPYISSGEFDHVRSTTQLAATVKDLLDEQRTNALMEKQGVGYFVGSLFASVLDPVSYIPFVDDVKFAKLGKAGLFALNGALSTGVSEAALQATQRHRSLEESLMNIGSSAIIGGGLGVFAAALHPHSAMNPANPHNVFKTENLRADGEISRDMLGRQDELSADELASLDRNFVAAGAAPLRDGGFKIARGTPTTPIGKAVRKVGDVFNSATIKGQLLRSNSDNARWLAVRLFDPAGILSEGNLKGVPNAVSATILKHDYMSEYERLAAIMEANTRQVSADTARRIDHKDVMLLTQRHLYGEVDPATQGSLTNKYGEAYTKVDEAAQKNAARIHDFNGMWEKRLIQHGIMQDPAVTSRLLAERDAAREAVKTAADTADEKTLNKLRATRDLAEQKYSAELQKPAPLGKDYGHAQLWNRDAIFQNPEEFKGWLQDTFAFKPEDLWLQEHHGMTAEQFDKLSPEEAKPIRDEWVGDEHLWRIESLETNLESQKQKLKEAQLNLREAMAAVGAARRDEGEISLSEARKRRDAIHAEIAANKAHQIALQKEIRSFKEAADAARRAGQDRAAREAAGIQTTQEITRDNVLARNDKLKAKLDKSLTDALTDPATPLDAAGNARVADAGDVAKLTDQVAASDAKVPVAEANARQTGDNISVATARQEGKAKEAALGLQRLIAEAEELDAKAARIQNSLREVEALHEGVTSGRQALEEAVSTARVARNLEARGVGAVKRALKGAKKDTPLTELINGIYEAVASSGHVPANMVNALAARSDREVGRVKARQVNLTRAQRVEAIKKGWLRDDLSNILLQSTDQLASEVSLREAIGIGPHSNFESWDDALRWVENDYQDKIGQVSDQKVKNQLHAEMKTTIKNIVEARDRLKGGSHIDDGTSNGWMRWGMNQMKRANMIRYGSGFTLSSLTDTATMTLRHGALSPLLVRYGTRAIKEMRAAITDDTSAFQSYIRAVEVGSGAHASAKRFGTDDALHGQLVGYGIGTGTTRKVTGQIDRVGEMMSEIGIKMGGLPLWNTFWKTVAGLHMIDRLHDLTGRYGALKPSEVADLATLGIGHGEASRISDMMAKFGETDAEGHFDPGFEKWTDRDAERTARLAIQRDMNRAINTPDVGDTPRLMSTHIGNMLLSFQTFAFAFMNQYAYPLVQRLSLFHEKQAYMSLGILLGSAMAVIVGKDLLNGRDPSQRFSKEQWMSTLYELVDRSGMAGYLSPYADSALKLTSPITGFAGGARYARNGWLESLLGINYSLVQDVQKTGAAWFDPTTSIGDKVRKTMVVAPFAAQAKLLGRLIPQN